MDEPLYERMSTGFTHADSNVREMTLKGVLTLVPDSPNASSPRRC